jgi:protein-L-isoaspartate(D-aspartate) O-methyltransferase
MKPLLTADESREARRRMVERQIEMRGVSSPLVLRAMNVVRREGYVPSYLGEFAYEDSPLPIGEEQTISQPFIVAFMIEALRLRGGERVLEVGTGSGYAAAVLAEIASEVWTIERHEPLARRAAGQLLTDGYHNVHVRCGDGTLGWAEAAPFDAIIVAAGGPEVPAALREQLAIGGRLVLPVGETVGLQKLVRVVRRAEDDFRTEDLIDVRFVPLIGEQGWQVEPVSEGVPPARPRRRRADAALVIADTCEPFESIAGVDLARLLERIGDARIVLMGESTHGTAEFYRMRARITEELIERKGFNIVALEADWPDAAVIDRHVRGMVSELAQWARFRRFPEWMWRNVPMREFLDELAEHNATRPPDQRVRVAGLDLYSMHGSIDAILEHLEAIDPATADVARERYGCLTPYQSDPSAYGRAALNGAYKECEQPVVRMLEELLQHRLRAMREQDERWFDLIQNARLVAAAEQYYRVMYYGSRQSWNLRDRQMFETLRNLLEFRGEAGKAVIWAHNSHVGDAKATEMAARGELNIGQLCREEFGDDAYSIGFGTDTGTVAAAGHWGGKMSVMNVRPALPDSYERLCRDAGVARFLLPLRERDNPRCRELLHEPRLERAIGVIYRSETERASHYFQASLPKQFDEWIWFGRTESVQPLVPDDISGAAELYPFGI